MKRLSHVLILITLILPMLTLVPTPATRPALNSPLQTGAGDFLPAQFVDETLRVAVYAEDNVSLPAYATGGVYTSNYAAIASLLASAGYDVTELTTQDILNKQLKTKSFDVFVLPDQLPRESITYLVKDFWLGGGGILSLHSSMGYLYYHGFIVPGDEGNFALLDVDPTPYWGYRTLDNVTVNERNPVTKAYEVGDQIAINGTTVILNRNELSPQIGDDYGDLLYETTSTANGLAFSIDTGARQGGRIVQLTGNYTTAPGWFSSLAIEAVDWLAPRPKARILYDLTHSPYYKLDTWDEGYQFDGYSQWRNIMVNHTYTVDKLHPSSEGNLTAANLEGYDMLVLVIPELNFTASEVAAVTSWVESGGGLFLLGDRWASVLIEYNQHLNYLLTDFDVSMFPTGDAGGSITEMELHPTTERCSALYVASYGLVNFTGDAVGVWAPNDVDYVSAADVHGSGRVVLFSDINWMADDQIGDESNSVYAANIANWLTSATADVLLLNGEFLDEDIYRVAPALALNSLGVNYYITHSPTYLNLSLYEYWDQWDLVIVDEPGMTIPASVLDGIDEWVDTGGELIISYYWMHNIADHPLWASLGVYPVSGSADEPDIHIWATGHPIFNLPVEYGESLFQVTVDYGIEGSLLHVFDNATALAGYTVSAQANQTAIAVRNDQQTLCNGFLIDEFQGDYDDSTYMDSFELWVDEIAFMYFDRPTIDSPADVTYTVGETGNEIIWTPNAPAGALRYVLTVNGSLDTIGPWNGGPIAVNVDGVNVSVTTYQLTVFDVLGYSVSDTVLLNVTAQVPFLGGIDPILLIAIGAGAVIVIAIVLIASKRRKK